MANYQRNRRRYQDYEENRSPGQSQYYSDYEGNPFSDEDDYGDPYDNQQGSDYGRPYRSDMNNPRQRRVTSDYDVNYRNQGYSSSSQRNRGQYDRSSYQGDYGYDMPQPGSEYRDEYDRGMEQGQYSQGQYGRGMTGQGQFGRGQYGRGMGQYSDYESQGSHRGKGFKGWKRSDDSIYDEIGQILEQRADIDPSDVEIKINNGEVILEGTVSDRMTKRRIEDALEMVSGIKDVQNRLRVKNDMNQGQNRQSQSDQSNQTSQSTQRTSSTSRSSEGQS